MAPVNTTDRLKALRKLFQEHDPPLDAYIIPTDDAHASEYIADCDARREFISGFSGSAGTAVVSRDKAALFTDGRYFIQAGQQLDSNWTLMKFGEPDVPSWQDYLAKNLADGSRIGLDPTLISSSDAKSITSSLSASSSASVIAPTPRNLVDAVWGSEQPQRPTDKVNVFAVEYAGVGHEEKIEAVQKEIEKRGTEGMVVSMLDEVAWLLNLRGTDIAFNPVFFAYVYIPRKGQGKTKLYVDAGKITDSVREHLGEHVEIEPYDAVFGHLTELSAKLASEDQKDGSAATAKKRKILVGTKTSLALVDALGGSSRVDVVRSPVCDAKGIKNPRELEGFRASHVRDGVALVRYFAWLQRALEKGEKWNEWDAAGVLEKYRSEMPSFKGLSFPTISSTGANAAIVHYGPDAKNSAVIDINEIYLCDSGGHYLDGTTDVTRTLHFGKPSDEEKRAFTRVLQGHIAIDRAVFPADTAGARLDAFARQFLWQDGLDYLHGTGHGIGYYLNVHEGPHGIGTRAEYRDVGLKVGMVVSNEPGYYEAGKFGIRIESVVLVKEVKSAPASGGKAFFGFERVTMCPIQTKLVDTSLLSTEERKWLNEYHEEVLKKLRPELEKLGDSDALAWLKSECAPIEIQ